MRMFVAFPPQITVPTLIDGHPVVGVADASFAHMQNLERLLLPEGLLRIGGHAFKGCSKLREVKLPTSLASIGREAFFGTSIESLRIPASCTDIQPDAFSLQGV